MHPADQCSATISAASPEDDQMPISPSTEGGFIPAMINGQEAT